MRPTWCIPCYLLTCFYTEDAGYETFTDRIVDVVASLECLLDLGHLKLDSGQTSY